MQDATKTSSTDANSLSASGWYTVNVKSGFSNYTLIKKQNCYSVKQWINQIQFCKFKQITT